MMSAVEGADSIFRFIQRTAEPVSEGMRWQTISYQDQPHYQYGAFNGCGGIGIFLAEYARQMSSAAALDLKATTTCRCSGKRYKPSSASHSSP